MAHSNPCSNIPIDVTDLLLVEGVEKQRLEFKKAWHNQKESGPRGPFWQVLHTVCAYANDFHNDGGGYIVIGVEENKIGQSTTDENQIILPPFGVPARDVNRIQNEIIRGCKQYIEPTYSPILSSQVVELEGEKRTVIVVWATASDNRPHRCKESEKGDNRPYYIRQGTETKKASSDEQHQLLSLQSSSIIPFDDRMARDTENGKQLSEEDIEFDLVKKFLKATNNRLSEEDNLEKIHVYQSLNLIKRIADKRVDTRLVPVFAPKNVALLFFISKPHLFFPGAKTEVTVLKGDDVVSNAEVFTGPIDQQIEESLSWILASTDGGYPAQAVLEALTNAFYHRGYEHCFNNPIKIVVKPDYIDISSYPGPNPSLEMKDFLEESGVPYVPSRNKRIGDFLKDRKLAVGVYTGVRTMYRTMKENGNPAPSFFFRASHFHVRLSKRNVSLITRHFQWGNGGVNDDHANGNDADEDGDADDAGNDHGHAGNDHGNNDGHLNGKHPNRQNKHEGSFPIQEQGHGKFLVDHESEHSCTIQPQNNHVHSVHQFNTSNDDESDEDGDAKDVGNQSADHDHLDGKHPNQQNKHEDSFPIQEQSHGKFLVDHKIEHSCTIQPQIDHVHSVHQHKNCKFPMLSVEEQSIGQGFQ